MSRRRHDPDSVGARLGSRNAVRAARKETSDEQRVRRRPTRPKAGTKVKSSGSTKAVRKTKAASKKTTAARSKTRRPSAGAALARFWPRLPSLRWPKTWVQPRFKTPEPIAERIEAFEAMPSPVRIHIVIGLFALFAFAVVVRSAQLQLVEGDAYYERAMGQGTTETRFVGRRGRILDRHGVELASSADAVSISAQRGRIDEPRRAARALAPALSVDRSWLASRLEGRGFVWLRRRVSPSMGAAVRALGLEGVEVHPARRRLYGNVRLASHVLGFVDIEEVGRRGVERSMQAQLQKREVRVRTMADALRRAVWSEGQSDDALASGEDVRLTVDRQVQFVAEEALEAAVREQKAKAGVAIVLATETSEVLAMASYPSFNPNNISGSEPGDRKNRALEADYEPGSTAKMVTLAAALEAGLATPERVIDCEQGRWLVDDRTIRDANHAFGRLTVREVLSKSSNIGAGKLGLEIGAKRLREMLMRFGFGARTGIELPAELKGRIRPAKAWRRVDLVNVSFGQGFTATPLQIAQAANVIANGGVWRAPTVLRRDGLSPEVPRRVLSPELAATLRSMMADVVRPGGTAPKAAIPGFVAAGKTGTAQKYDVRRRGYSREKYVASFVGFVPADRPKVTVLVLVDEPKGSIYGGPVAGPVFRRVAEAALASMEMYPSPALASTVRADPEPVALVAEVLPPTETLDEAVADLTFEIAKGDGLSETALALLGEALPRRTGPREVSKVARVRRMPDLRGLSVRSAMTRCRSLGLEASVTGTGRVVRQLPRPGVRIREARECSLELRRDG